MVVVFRSISEWILTERPRTSIIDTNAGAREARLHIRGLAQHFA